jgi:hypothetical protein
MLTVCLEVYPSMSQLTGMAWLMLHCNCNVYSSLVIAVTMHCCVKASHALNGRGPSPPCAVCGALLLMCPAFCYFVVMLVQVLCLHRHAKCLT